MHLILQVFVQLKEKEEEDIARYGRGFESRARQKIKRVFGIKR